MLSIPAPGRAWRRPSLKQTMIRFADLLLENAEAGLLETLDMGKPIGYSLHTTSPAPLTQPALERRGDRQDL